jgi:hypothetical protein
MSNLRIDPFTAIAELAKDTHVRTHFRPTVDHVPDFRVRVSH